LQPTRLQSSPRVYETGGGMQQRRSAIYWEERRSRQAHGRETDLDLQTCCSKSRPRNFPVQGKGVVSTTKTTNVPLPETERAELRLQYDRAKVHREAASDWWVQV
jgi:hypothetical protein